MKKPYVGVTGPVTPMEASEVASIFQSFSRVGLTHRPMIGYLVSNETLSGEVVSNRRYPRVDQIPLMAERAAEITYLNKPVAFQTVHYNTRNLDNLGHELNHLFQTLGPSTPVTGVQLNIAWPFANQIANFKDAHPDVEVIFQANSKVLGYLRKNYLKKKSFNHEAVAERIGRYGGLIDHVLIDASGGTGTSMNIRSAAAFGKAISEAHPNVRVGYAGGLCGENVVRTINRLEKLLGHNNFSLDAEGKLRDKISDAYGDDCLNDNEVMYYVSEVNKRLHPEPLVFN